MKTTILVFLTALSPLISRAADEIKPLDVKLGLWETTTKSDVGGMPAMASMPQIPEETLAKMPPEQRARVEAMMKGRGAGSPMNNTVRTCTTKESRDRGMDFLRNNDKSCTYKVLNSTADKLEMHMECTRQSMKTAGNVTVDRVDSEHVKSTVVMQISGGPMTNMRMTIDAKWVSSDCGDVKPPAIK
jgi:hypothetical protein